MVKTELASGGLQTQDAVTECAFRFARAFSVKRHSLSGIPKNFVPLIAGSLLLEECCELSAPLGNASGVRRNSFLVFHRLKLAIARGNVAMHQGIRSAEAWVLKTVIGKAANRNEDLVATLVNGSTGAVTYYSTDWSWNGRLGDVYCRQKQYITRMAFAVTIVQRILNYGSSDNHRDNARPNKNTVRLAPVMDTE